MTAQSGAAFLLKISNDSTPAVYQTVAGLRTTQMAVAGQAVTVTTKDSAGWRQLLNQGGARSISISAAGVFQGSAAEAQILANSLNGTIDNYQLAFADGHTLTGQFLVQKLDYSGDFNNERSYTIQLESSGVMVWA